jgi:hypothetical protein
VPDQLRAEVERFLRKCTANYCAKVVQSSVERMEIVGFRIPTDDADQGRPAGAPQNDAEKLAWQIWQQSNLDAEQFLAFNDMDRLGVGYLLAGPDGVTRESPWQCIVEYAPKRARCSTVRGLSPTRLAGCRCMSSATTAPASPTSTTSCRFKTG